MKKHKQHPLRSHHDRTRQSRRVKPAKPAATLRFAPSGDPPKPRAYPSLEELRSEAAEGKPPRPRPLQSFDVVIPATGEVFTVLAPTVRAAAEFAVMFIPVGVDYAVKQDGPLLAFTTGGKLDFNGSLHRSETAPHAEGDAAARLKPGERPTRS